MTDLYVLVGSREAHSPEESSEEVQLALFSSESAARDYERVSRLSSYSQHGCGRGQHGHQYCSGSLLSQYCSAWVEAYEPPEELPLDPVLVRRRR